MSKLFFESEFDSHLVQQREHLTCLWHQKTNLKCCIKARDLLKALFNGVFFLIYYFKKHFKPCFFILKALKDILQHFKFVNL